MTGGTGKGSDGLANLRGLNHWVLQAFKVRGADLWYRATTVLLQRPVQAVLLSLDEELENSQGCGCSGPVLLTFTQEGWFVSRCTAEHMQGHFSSMVSSGYYQLLHNST